jgi:short-subunit dehydrogenase
MSHGLITGGNGYPGKHIVTRLISKSQCVTSLLAPPAQDIFRGKVVLITGGSSGIGFASAKQAVSYGAKVILVARNQKKLAQAADILKPIANENKGAIDIQSYDLSNLNDCDKLVTYILTQYGYVDILFNNAGHSIRRSISKSFDRFHDLERTMKINYFGATRLVLGLLPSMVERKSGHIIHSSTMGTMAPTPRFGAYLASKSALDAYMDALAAEYADQNIYATSIKYPLVKTEMISPTKEYKDVPAASPEFAAQMFVDAVLNRPRKQITGTGKIMGTMSLFAPNVMTQLYSYWYTVWPDDKDNNQQKRLDRALVKKLIPKSPL